LQQAQLSLHQQTIFYLIILVLAFFAMVPFIIIAEKKRQMKKVMQCAVAVMLSSQILFLSNHTASVTSLAIGVFLFFTAFTLLESILPSLVSKIAPLNIKGTAMGVYSTSQFLGIFIGGSAGGLLMHRYHQTGVFIFAILLLLLWLYSLATMQQPPYGSTMIFKLPSKIISNTLQQTLAATTGVYDVAIIAEEQLIYIKADKTIIDKNGLRNLIESANLN
jgi:MFS family permease